MSWIWITQIALDLAFIFTLMALLKPDNKKAIEESTIDDKIAVALQGMENRTRQLERDILQYRKTIEEQQSALLGLYEKARQLIEQNENRLTTYSPSWEEQEFKATAVTVAEKAEPVSSASSEPKIPTLQELEQTRERHRHEVNLDLKTILRDQLA